MSDNPHQKPDSPFRALVKRVVVPELRQGLRAQFAFRTRKTGARKEQLVKPLMTGDETDLDDAWVRYLNLLSKILDDHAPDRIDAILEWGMGHSTSYLYEIARNKGSECFVCIEHNERYFNAFSKRFPNASFFQPRVQERVGFSPRRAKQAGENYATCALGCDRKFDLILIDGRRRNECLLVASEILSDNGIVILHDAQRSRYGVGSRLFDIVAEYPEESGFRIMRRRGNRTNPQNVV